MPIVVKSKPRTKRKSTPVDRHPDLTPIHLHNVHENTPDQRVFDVSDSTPPGRIRRYSHPDDPISEWNPRSPDTPEGRLSNYNSSDWYVPTGGEIHLRFDDGRVRLEGSDQIDEIEQRYRPSDFSVKSRNNHDHNVPWRSSVTPEMANKIRAILRSRKFPFNDSEEQFTNVALYELIQICSRLEPIPDSHIAVLESMNELNKNYRVVVDYDTTIRRNCRTIHDLIERGLKNQARVMLHDLMRTISRIKVRELREKHLKRVKSEFGGLISGAKPVKGKPVRSVAKKQ